MKKPKYTSVEEMAKAIVPNEEFNKELSRQLAARSVANHLVALRGAKGISQKDVAKSMNCSQSRISKLEQTDDADIRLGDLVGYLHAVDYTLHLGMSEKRQPLADAVKYHVYSIRRALQQMVKLAHLDETIAKGVASFFGEACYNFMTMMQKSASEMPSGPSGQPLMSIDIISQEFQPEPLANGLSGFPSSEALPA